MQTNNIKKKKKIKIIDEEEVRRIVREICNTPKHHAYKVWESSKDPRPFWDDFAKAWKTMNDSIKIPAPLCMNCDKELNSHIKVYCKCGYVFCSVKCSNQYHKEKKHE